MKRWLSQPSALVLLTALLWGCSSAPSSPPEPAIDPLEQYAMDAINMQAVWMIDDALAQARTRYEALDDLPGQWRITRLQVLHALARGDREAAQLAARRLGEIRNLTETTHTLGLDIGFETELVLGRTFDDPRAFQRALAEANRPVERAIVLAWLDETQAALDALAQAADPAPDDRAFVHYRHGQATADASHLETALDLFRQAGDSRGIADALFALAQLAAADGDSDQARALATRAQRTLEAIGDAKRSGAVALWLDQL